MSMKTLAMVSLCIFVVSTALIVMSNFGQVLVAVESIQAHPRLTINVVLCATVIISGVLALSAYVTHKQGFG